MDESLDQVSAGLTESHAFLKKQISTETQAALDVYTRDQKEAVMVVLGEQATAVSLHLRSWSELG